MQQNQQQFQYPVVAPQQQQRVSKYPSGQEQTQKLQANSTRQPMRTNNKKAAKNDFHNQQQTPISNYRPQQPPPVKQSGHVKSNANKTNNNGN